jgi:hypothetical protein
MDMAEQLALVRGEEKRSAIELTHAAGVVEERGRDQEVRAQPRVDLRDVPADGGDRDRVLQKPARVGVMRVRRRR